MMAWNIRKKVSFYESIKFTVWKQRKQKKIKTPYIKVAGGEYKRILILVNHEVVIYNFRLELVERLLTDGYEVHISTPTGKRVDKLRDMGVVIHDISFNRHGMNPAEELQILTIYKKLIKDIHPFIVLGYTIKPNIYGSMAAWLCGAPFVANITGVGTAVERGGLSRGIIMLMYKVAFGGRKGKIQRVFFQNEGDEKFFRNKRIAFNKHALLPGSGVNTKRFPFTKYPDCGNGIDGSPIKFAFISRIMTEKGIDQYLAAAEEIKNIYPNTEFHVCGFFEPEYDQSNLNALVEAGTVIYDGNIEDVAGFMRCMHCIVHPTYYPEGLSNVLLEALSCGRPIITTDRIGCRETCSDGKNGLLVREKDVAALGCAIKYFIELPQEEKALMGIFGRKLAEEHFDRTIIVNMYMNEIYKAEKAQGESEQSVWYQWIHKI